MNNGTSPPVRVLEYDWLQYVKLIEDLILRVRASYSPKQIIGISSGGLVPAVILAKALDVPLGVMAAVSYETGGSGLKDAKGAVRLGQSMASVMPKPGSHILLVDDLTDSGETLFACAAWLQEFHGDTVREIRTAVIWHKMRSSFRPDFLAQEVRPDELGNYPWIIQPFEKYEKRLQ